jgi:hypothetical protein
MSGRWIGALVVWIGALEPAAEAVPGVTLTATGTCPGTVEFRASGGTPGGVFAAVRAPGAGAVYVPSGPCIGTQLGLNASVRLLAERRFDASGTFVAVATLGAGSCGRHYQVLDLSDCSTSDVAVR